MKAQHSLKFRFILIFVIFIAALVVSSSLFSIFAARSLGTDIFSAQGVEIVKKASSLINGDDFEAFLKAPDTDGAWYKELQEKLLVLKENSGAVYFYTMSPVEGDTWQFVVDGSDVIGGENFSAFGDTDDVSAYDAAFARCIETRAVTPARPADQGEWGWVVSIYAPIENSKGDLIGVTGCDFDAQALMDNINMTVTRQVILGGIFLVVGLVVMFLFVALIFNRLANINSVLAEISSGEGDLTTRIEVKHDDEIGDIAGHVNKTLEKIKALVVTIKAEAAELYDIGSELSGNMGETSENIGDITSSIGEIRKSVESQAASVSEAGATMEKMALDIGRLNGNVEAQAESVAQSSSAIEEMLANIRSVTDTLVKNAENVERLTGASDAGRSGLNEVSADIGEIAKESEGLLQINAVMQNIASQTNLLSMNAAIEAAHAGEAGKGFAVVADEIRKLAENSSDQSKIISDTLKKIKSSIDKIAASTNAVLEQFKAIDTSVRTVSNQETVIRNAMEEQGVGSQQILEAVSKMNDLSGRVKQGSEEMSTESGEVIEESKNLETVTQKISESMSHIASGAGRINEAIERVNAITEQNKEHINTLTKEVSRFKIE